MTTTFLMCEPKYFEVDYVINPWMKGQVHKVDHERAKQEWRDFYNHLQEFAAVELINPEPNLPDLVFTANAGLIVNKHFVLSRFCHPQRQPEEPFFKRWFAEHDYTVSELPNDIYFEGHGDAVFQRGKKLLWLGYGMRTQLSALDYLKTKTTTPIKPLELVDERFYHLDTCFCSLLDGYIMYYPPAFSDDAQQSIHAAFPTEKRIIVNDEDAAHFVCNAVLVATDKIPSKKGVIFVNAISDELQTQLDSLGYKVQIQPVSEFRKAGGANQCLTLKLT